MNTYAQDETIPIYITLQYGINILKFPINPDELSPDTDSASQSAEIEGIGEVSIPTTPKLKKLSIKSFFWHEVNLLPAFMYVQWIEKWQKSKKPANLIVTRLNYSMKVTCERFVHLIKAGEEKDVYFELDLKEYRPYGAKRLGVNSNLSLMEAYQKVLDIATMPVLVEIPRPQRDSIRKEEIGNIYTVVKPYTTLTAISKKITGSTENWKEIYDENKEELGDIIGEGDEIPVGTEIKVPAKYVTKKNESQSVVGVG